MGDASYKRISGVIQPKTLKVKRSGRYTYSRCMIINQGAPAPGTGYLAGKLTGTDPIQPAQIRILYRHANQGSLGDGYLVAVATVSAAGTWRVDNLNTSLRYDVVARRSGYNDVITANVQPLPM